MNTNVIPITSAKRKSIKAPYNFDPEWERGFIAVVATSPKFYALVGEEVEVDSLESAPCKLALQAAQAVFKDSGSGPRDARHVLQRLRSWMSNGKITLTQIEEVMNLFDDEEDRGLPDHGALLTEVKPILRRRLELQALETGMSEYQNRRDPSKALAHLTRARAIGTVPRGIGSRLGPASVEQMSRLMKVRRLETHMSELDQAIEGGPLRGTLSMFIGGSGAGKSMGLVQVAVAAAIQGFHVGVATLELPEEMWTARLIANISAVPVNEILRDTYGCGALEALDAFLYLPSFGNIQIHGFTPKVTTPTELFTWVTECEESWGAPMDVLVVDYADKLGARGRSEKDSSYATAGSVYEDLYTYAKDHSKWVWTASQATRAAKGHTRKMLDLDDVSDSMHKVRTSDLVVTLNPQDEYQSMCLFTAKNRLGKPRQKVGPYPCDFACARILPPSYAGGAGAFAQ